MRRHLRLRSITTLFLGTALLASCGGDDAEQPADEQPADEQPADEQPADAVAPAAELDVGEGDTVRDVLTDAIGDQGVDIDAVIAATPAETRFGSVASQLEPEPTVEVDGGDIRLVFDGGTVSNATFDCIVGGSFVEPGETLTVVYPDGEQTC